MLEKKSRPDFYQSSVLTFVCDNFEVSESLSLSQTNANGSESSVKHSAALVLKLAGGESVLWWTVTSLQMNQPLKEAEEAQMVLNVIKSFLTVIVSVKHITLGNPRQEGRTGDGHIPRRWMRPADKHVKCSFTEVSWRKGQKRWTTWHGR